MKGGHKPKHRPSVISAAQLSELTACGAIPRWRPTQRGGAAWALPVVWGVAGTLGSEDAGVDRPCSCPQP